MRYPTGIVKSFLLLLVVVMGTLNGQYRSQKGKSKGVSKKLSELNHLQKKMMMEQVHVRLAKLWNPATGDILTTGFSAKDKDNWLKSIKELVAYRKKTESFFLSSSYTKLFNNYIKELEVASADLFKAVESVRSNALLHSSPEVLKKKYDALKMQVNRLQALIQKLEEKNFTDLKSTKEIKKVFLLAGRSFEKIYKKVLDELSALRDSVHLKRI